MKKWFRTAGLYMWLWFHLEQALLHQAHQLPLTEAFLQMQPGAHDSAHGQQEWHSLRAQQLGQV